MVRKLFLAILWFVFGTSFALAHNRVFYQATIRQLIKRDLCQTLLLNSPTPDFSSVKTQYSGFTSGVELGEAIFRVEDFAFEVMVDRNIISKAEAKAYAKSTQSIDPVRITYVEVGRHSQRPSLFINGQPIFAVDDKLTLLRMVAGQMPETNKLGFFHNKTIERKLPWMQERGFEKLSKQVDRTQHKFIYEWGRAADADGSGLIGQNVALMTFLAARDVVLNGGHLEDAYIYLHSTRRANTVLYRRKYKFEVFGVPEKKAEHTILVRSLKSLIDEIKPWAYFQDLADLMHLERLGTERAIELYDGLKSYQNTMLDLYHPTSNRQVGVLTITDRSSITEGYQSRLVDELVSAGGERKEIERFIAKNMRRLPMFYAWPELAHHHAAHSLDKNAVEIGLSLLWGGKPSQKTVAHWLAGLLEFYRSKLSDAAIAKLNFFAVAEGSEYEILANAGFQLFIDPSRIRLDRSLEVQTSAVNTRLGGGQILRLSGAELISQSKSVPRAQARNAAKIGDAEFTYKRYSLE